MDVKLAKQAGEIVARATSSANKVAEENHLKEKAAAGLVLLNEKTKET
jgi:hypothetical protein